ncbi:(2Fe-2S)-binding protein [Bradyrhizobium sp. WBOS7]|uniref:(2Fe-2S)-binding protein n=1 Tax=Bradyrhizobium betae TaxID=244734 RepID=A0AAE9NFN4_9BRAD|nr:MULTISPECIES: (2Fe-2S)-binding protein [Bradyrhizobium]MDD1573658.1 (2Fe-2S)-binding protein [Bradyrhizobium sp. WBOS1]UUO38345.1 (2Fe-2S)-binding protein [Bradyrhizobium sp. WBOS01]MDD1530191.1 (2Fe-2S)-binding protein [Bradyrhizobium sp. WBOS2]MDD1579489.1 (2Fe-2S)-binding protein [Bradyrhizobium sp. WBOS7]MDD1602154.1 (2Fe-2S)-binding protein [Bradyrhizobium sp. WBOS16]
MSGFDETLQDEAEAPVRVRFVVNGRKVACEVAPRDTLVDCLRDKLELTGTHAGCEMGACGACLVQLDGRAIHSCLIYAVQADGARIDTIEGLSEGGVLADLQAEFHRRNALQCGFCTPGMLINAQELLSRVAEPGRGEIRDALSGNYCRCTGYEAIVDAIDAVAKARSKGGVAT